MKYKYYLLIAPILISHAILLGSDMIKLRQNLDENNKPMFSFYYDRTKHTIIRCDHQIVAKYSTKEPYCGRLRTTTLFTEVVSVPENELPDNIRLSCTGFIDPTKQSPLDRCYFYGIYAQ